MTQQHGSIEERAKGLLREIEDKGAMDTLELIRLEKVVDDFSTELTECKQKLEEAMDGWQQSVEAGSRAAVRIIELSAENHELRGKIELVMGHDSNLIDALERLSRTSATSTEEK